VLPGIIGALQANEVIKLIVGAGDPMIGRLLLFDALKLKFRELKLRKDPACPICSQHPTQHGLVDYDQLCGIAPAASVKAAPAAGAASLTGAELDFDVDATELKRWLDEGRDFQLIDVRSPQEYAICNIAGARLVPLQDLADELESLDPAVHYVVHCHSGARSTRAVQVMRQQGFARSQNLAGGIDAWSRKVDPSVPRY
jgi:adenylyltransferase/sulfurtransferase